MAGQVIVEEVVTVLAYEATPKPLIDSAKAVDALDKQNKAAVVSTDKLTAKMDDLADQMQETSDRALALKEQQLRLQRQIDATGKPTAEQRKEMHRLKMELEDNAIHAKKLAASQKALQRELKATREETKRLADEERKAARAQREADRAKQQAQRAQAQQAKEEERALSQAFEGGRRRRADARKAFGAGGFGGPKIPTPAADTRTDVQGVLKQAVASRTGIDLSAMTAGAAGATAAAAAVAALAAGMVALGSRVFEVSSRFQSLRASLITVTGSAQAADKQFEVIKDFASTTPYQVDNATQAFVKLKALGLDASTKSLTSYGNTASAMGKDLNDMIEAVADATTGEFERLKEFGIKASSQGDKVSFTFRGVTTTVKKEAGAIEDYLRQIGEVQFAGAMERQMDTIGGVVSNLEDRFDSFLLKIGEGGQMEGLKNVIEDVSALMSDELAVALGELQAEGTGILEDIVGEIEPEQLAGLVEILSSIVQILRVGLQPLIAMVDFFAETLDKVGDALGYVKDTAGEAIDGLGSVFDTLKDEGLGKAADEAWELAKSLTSVADEAESAKTSLVSLFSEALTAKLKQMGSQIEHAGKRMIQGATVGQLQQLRGGSNKELARIADEELIRRQQAEVSAREEALFQAGGGEKFTPDVEKKAMSAIEDAADVRADEAYRSARASGMSAAEAKRVATIAKGEEMERLTANYDVTGQVPKKKGKGKGSKPKYHGLEKIVRARAEELGEQAGEREAARLTVDISEGKSTMSIEEAMEAGQTKRAEVRDKILRDFYSSGRLPAGVRSDLQRLTQIPSVEQQIGKVAPPVIAVNNYRVDARVGVMNVGERSTFSGTAGENAQALLQLVDARLSEHIRLALVDVTQGEIP